MARGFRSSRGGLPAPKRQIGNDGFGSTAVVTMGASLTGSALAAAGFILTVPAATLVRTRGILGAAVTISGANNNIITGVFGLMIVSAEAFLAGAASVSTPLDDIERAWVVWQPFSVYADGTTLGESSGRAAFDVQHIDSRGMRKMKLDDTLAPVVECRQNDATINTVVEVTFDLRFQFKL